MELLSQLMDRLQRHPKRIVFPEGDDIRVIQAARQFQSLRLGAPILLGKREKIERIASGARISLEGIRIIDPQHSEDLERLARAYRMLVASHGMKLVECKHAMLNPNYFGAMMVALHQADGFVSGATSPTSVVLRPLTQIVRLAPGIRIPVGCAVAELEDRSVGARGVLFLADCAVSVDPSMDDLADIAVATAKFAHHICGIRPKVAFISHATRTRTSPPGLGKVSAAVDLAIRKAEELSIEADFDGEMQIDTALVPEVALRKLPRSKVAGQANVLVFPDLHSANIAVKLIMHLVHSRVYAALLLGLNRPAASVSRGSTSTAIFNMAVLVGAQAINYHELYPGAI